MSQRSNLTPESRRLHFNQCVDNLPVDVWITQKRNDGISVCSGRNEAEGRDEGLPPSTKILPRRDLRDFAQHVVFSLETWILNECASNALPDSPHLMFKRVPIRYIQLFP